MKRFATILAAGLFLPACSAGDDPPAPNGGAAGTPTIPGAGSGPVGSGGTGPVGSGGTGPGTAGANTGAGHSVGYSLECPTPKSGSPTLRLLTKTEFDNTLNDIFPTLKGKWANSLPASPGSETGFDNSTSNVVGNQLAGELLETAESVGTAVTADLPGLGLNACASGTPNQACAEEFLSKYGTRLFRRPLNAPEKDTYVAYFNKALAASDGKTALKWMTVGLIQSPNAVYRSELGVESGGTRKLTQYELATELAYTFTGSTPSQELITRAQNNQLEGNLVEEATKLLTTTEGGKRVLHRFFESYVDYPKVVSMVKAGNDAFPQLSRDMVQETRAFIDDVVVSKGGGMKELLTATTTNPSPALAQHYGFPAPASAFSSVQRPADRGIGIFAQGAFLGSHSNTDASSPTQRGLFILYRLLCQPPLKPPAGVPQISEAAKTNTTRERYEKAHAGVGACAACHKRFDPIGFGFEHYDQTGKYREKENGFDIDSSGTITDIQGNPVLSFTNQEELMTELAKQPVVHQCLAAYMATYAFGTAEACLGSSQAQALQAGTMGIVQAFAALAAEPHFTQRNAK